MAIPAKHIVSVTTRLISGGSSDLETYGMLLTKSALIPTQTPAITYTSASDVAALFGDSSDEYAFASQYFAGVNNQQTGVKSLVIGRRVDASVSAWVRGGTLNTTLANLKAITSGSLTLTIDGTETAKTGIDLSSATSLSDVGTLIATAFVSGVTVTYSSVTNTFTVASSTTGSNSSIVVGEAESGTDLATTLCLTDALGAVKSAGCDSRTPATDLDKICQVTRNWVGFTTIYSLDTTNASTSAANIAEAKALAAWADSESDYFYCDWTLDPNCLSTTSQSTTKPAQLMTTYNCVACVYGTWLEAAFVLACGASIKWDAIQGMKVWFGKSASGITARIADESAANALEAIRCNYFGDFATRNASFRFFNRGTLTSTQYAFIDVLYGAIWFRNKVQRSCMDGFAANRRVPYNARGSALIASWLQDPINAAIRVGVIDVGMELSESQKAQIINETDDESIVNKLFTNGYWYSITMPDASVRADRGSPVVTIYFTYAGSVQKLEAEVVEVL